MTSSLKIVIVVVIVLYLLAGICSTICYNCCCKDYQQEKMKQMPKKIDYGLVSPPPDPKTAMYGQQPHMIQLQNMNTNKPGIL